uniref:Uncharacterized protein n=1 Tax=Clytia hemisphaerica TaxID=252671 RepID=A0A7M5XIW4_9CNID
MVKLESISFLCLLVDTVLGLICQKCTSTSIRNCDRHIQNMTCIYPMDICITMTTSYTIRKQNGIRETISEVTKRCALSKYGCENMCNVQPGHNCQIGCCTGNFCNRTPDPRILRSINNSINLREHKLFRILKILFTCSFVIMYLQ